MKRLKVEIGDVVQCKKSGQIGYIIDISEEETCIDLVEEYYTISMMNLLVSLVVCEPATDWHMYIPF